MKTSLVQILYNEDSYLNVENISTKLKDCIIKTNRSDCFITNLLLYFIVKLLMYLPVMFLFII